MCQENLFLRKDERKMKKNVGELIVMFVVLAAGAANAQMVGYWEFEGNTNDSSGNGNNGTLMDNATYGDGVFGQAISLDGRQDYALVGNESNFDITDKITVAAWIKMPVITAGPSTIVSKGNNAWRLQVWGYYRIRLDCDGVWPGDLNAEVMLDDHQWHHVAGVYDGTKLSIYVDGVTKASQKASGSINTNDYPLSIGDNSGLLGREWRGFIDEVAIFDHALSATEIAKLYCQGGISFDTKRYMHKLVEETKATLREQNPEEATAFIEGKIDESEEWQEKNASDIRLCDKLLSSELYFLLAKARAAAGYVKKDVVAMCKRAIFPLEQGLAGGTALTWLFENVPSEQYTGIVEDLVRDNVAHKYQLVVREFETEGNWQAFKAFLDVMFNTVENPVVIAEHIENSLNVWRGKYVEYCRSKPQLTEYMFEKDYEAAEKYVAKYNYKEAVRVYRDIMKRCGPSRRTAKLELEVCKCLLDSGEYQNAISRLDAFIERYKGIYKAEVIKALSMKGKAYVQLGDTGRAIEPFLVIMTEYPEAKQAPEAGFFVGYGYMVKQAFEQATAAFNVVAQDYPESSYASRARSYLGRIKNMVR